MRIKPLTAAPWVAERGGERFQLKGELMQLTDIPRIKAGNAVAERVATGERGSLAVEAQAKLGYGGLLADVTGTKKLGECTGKLTESLLRLEIDVLDTATVVKYQVEEAGRVTLEHIHRNFEHYVAGWVAPASWKHTDLDKYKEAVPEFVIRKAIQIKTAMPEVIFIVQHMSDPKADPFLVAKFGQRGLLRGSLAGTEI